MSWRNTQNHFYNVQYNMLNFIELPLGYYDKWYLHKYVQFCTFKGFTPRAGTTLKSNQTTKLFLYLNQHFVGNRGSLYKWKIMIIYETELLSYTV